MPFTFSWSSAMPAILLCALLVATIQYPSRAFQSEKSKVKVKPKIALQVQPFPLEDVKLLDGPFKHAQELDHKYLLSLDPDRMLHCFRITAGLPSNAEPLGGWEKPDSEVRGHFVGHYLSAASRMAVITGDEVLKQRLEYMVSELAKCQDAMKSGYLSAFPEEFIDRVENGKPVWAPWYTLHKIFAGLQDTYVYCNNQQALDVARKMAEWERHRAAKLTDAQMQAMLGNEHGGMNETLANLYALTGDKNLLTLAERFNHHSVLDPLSKHDDILTGLHANTQIPKFIGTAEEYELTGTDWEREASSYFWDTVAEERSYVIGGHSDNEMFTPKEKLSTALGPRTTETCNTYNMLKLTRHLFTWNPKVEYADFCERALFNHILSSQNTETGMMCYYVPLRSGSRKEYSTPMDSFWCCTGTGIENHARYCDSIYFHNPNSLYVNLFMASILSWREKGATVRQETSFPDAPSSKLVFSCSKPVKFAVHIRHPFWAGEGFGVKVNGEEKAANSKPDSYVVVERTWRTGDVVEISLPMTLRTEGFRDNPKRLAFLFGPIVLCARTNSTTSFPALISPVNELTSRFTRASGQSLDFTSDAGLPVEPGVKTTDGITLTPFFRVHDSRYIVYFDVLSTEEWRAKEEQQRVEQARKQEMESRTIDSVAVGNENNEREHRLAGERTDAGDFGDRKWRHAVDGGWFSYEMKVDSSIPSDLVCTYWGSDSGKREFEILVDGTKIAVQKLENNRPNEFIDVIYPLDSELLKEKKSIVVRFQALPGCFAGGVFDCRIMKKQ